MTIQIAGSGLFGLALQEVDSPNTGGMWSMGYDYTGFGNTLTGDPYFHYYPYTNLGYGPNQQVSQLPLEAGRSIMTRGAYKSSIYGGGPLSMIPRLDGDFGYVLMAALGRSHMIQDRNLDGAVAAGCQVHEFMYDDIEESLPYYTARRKLPHVDTTKALGEVTYDNHIGNLEISIPTNSPIMANVEQMGRRTQWESNPTWATPTFDDDNSFLVGVHNASRVSLEVDGVLQELKATGATISINNNLLPPNQAQIIGDPVPLDYPVLSRAASIRVQALVENWDIYNRIFTNAAFGASGTYSDTVYQGDVDIRAYSPMLITGQSTEFFGFQFLTTGNNISWSLQGAGVQLAPGSPIMITLVGTVQRATSGAHFKIRVQNDVTTPYTTPRSVGIAVDGGSTATVSYDRVRDAGHPMHEYMYYTGYLTGTGHYTGVTVYAVPVAPATVVAAWTGTSISTLLGIVTGATGIAFIPTQNASSLFLRPVTS